MKKIYAFLAAALMSASLFAAPSQSDLASYVEEGYYVACFQAPVGTTCNDIYWMGEYCGWNISAPLDELVKCEPLAGNDGWYVAKVPVVEGKNNDGKPIQLNECGKMTWDVQPGTFEGATVEVLAGSVTVSPNGAEIDLKDWSASEATIVTIGSWKNGYDPCTKVCEQQSYTIRVYPPYCEYLEDLEPSIRGSFNQWGDPLPMTFKGTYFEYVSEPVSASFEFKFNNNRNDKEDWSHQFEAYDELNDKWHFIPEEGNISLTTGTEYYTREGNVLTFDFSDDTKYRYAGCAEPEEASSVVVSLIAPANAPEKVEIVGSFDGWKGTEMTLENGQWVVLIEATATDMFKFRSGIGATDDDKWNNQIQIPDGEGGWKNMGDMAFSDYWQDGEKGVKVVTLDFSDAAAYKWTLSQGQGIENIVLTEEVQKVVVDGVIYIVRDNKMFNIHGAQVR